MVTSVTLPNNDEIFLSELTVSLYKEILKSTYGEDYDTKGFLQTISTLFSKLTKKPSSYFLTDISIFDLFYLLIESRIQSMGNNISLSVNNTKNNKPSTLSFNLEHIKTEIKLFCQTNSNIKITGNEFCLIFNIPSVDRLKENTDNEYLYFLKSLSVTNSNKCATSIVPDVASAELILNKISAKKLKEFENTFENYISANLQMNFLKRYGVNEVLRFIPSIDHLIWFTKLIFSEPLDVFYHNVFCLSKYANLNPLYIEQCTPGEYLYFIKTLQASLKQEPNSSEQDSMLTNIANEF